MSTQFCGCDPEANWTCDTHREIAESLRRFQQRLDAERAMAETVPIPTDLSRVADVLATFYRAELSMSSVAPVLALAEELNPSLKETR